VTKPFWKVCFRWKQTEKADRAEIITLCV